MPKGTSVGSNDLVAARQKAAVELAERRKAEDTAIKDALKALDDLATAHSTIAGLEVAVGSAVEELVGHGHTLAGASALLGADKTMLSNARKAARSADPSAPADEADAG